MELRESEKTDKTVYIQTFGCQMNEYDSVKMLEQLRAIHYTQVQSPQLADLILINTCAIREKAEHKVYSLLGRLAPLKKKRPGLTIGVTGCVAQQQGREILRRASQVDLVLGTDNLFELPQMLREVNQGRRVAKTDWSGRNLKIANFIPAEIQTRGIPGEFKANLAITKGCNNFCSFCVVPHTRGLEVSRTADNILEEARALAAEGIREITLLGQNVNSYQALGVDFMALLEGLQEISGLERIRYTSPHPKDFSESLARAHRDLPKLCEHLHLPFQSGSNRILKAMRRWHSIESYLDKLALVRGYVPGIALSTDIIVGFPGEDEADFLQTLAVLEKVRFDQVYAFKYSPRANTPAATYENQVPEAVRAERLARLFEVQALISQERNNALVGSSQEVLLEYPHPKHDTMGVGRSRGNKVVHIVDCAGSAGSLISVEIVTARKFSLIAREQKGG